MPLSPTTDVEVATRALRVDEPTWRAFVERARGTASRSLEHLRAAWFESVPAATRASEHGTAVPPLIDGSPCPACSEIERMPVADDAVALAYARCRNCGHGILVRGAAELAVHTQPDYYERMDSSGAGYDRYLEERTYRETKGGRLLDRIEALGGRRFSSMLEIGSGFGFTRAAAQSRGMLAFGVDTNPLARERARSLYGMETFTGTLAALLAAGTRGAAPELVLYQFVLEHIEDVGGEIAHAGRAVAPGGVIALLVPSIDAAELEVFGAWYRSFRGDHRHLFSIRSVRSLFERAGLFTIAIETGADLQLLRGLLSEEELTSLDRAGRGPDILAIARRASA